jgi:lysine 2,3-aminomutase
MSTTGTESSMGALIPSRPDSIRATETDAWTDWRWQQQNGIRTADDLLRAFPGINLGLLDRVRQHVKIRRMYITPYFLRLIERDSLGAPKPEDPLWCQVVPTLTEATNNAIRYDGETENWELEHEMVTPIAQWKYDNRVLVRFTNVCHSYCQFCYEALRTIEKDSTKSVFQHQHWIDTIEFIRVTPRIEEVILSGGEPLMQNDERLDAALADLRDVGRYINIRIHTRALSFNPYRVTDALISILEKHQLNALGLHVTHPREITAEFRDTLKRLRRAVPIIFANIPLLHGVNDDIDLMHRFWMDLYSVGVIPHYLYHFMPFSPGADTLRTTVEKGIEIVAALKRRVTNLAVPEFVLAHATGKYTVPLSPGGDGNLHWATNERGEPIVRFKNWCGNVVDYPNWSPNQ